MKLSETVSQLATFENELLQKFIEFYSGVAQWVLSIIGTHNTPHEMDTPLQAAVLISIAKLVTPLFSNNLSPIRSS